MEIIAMVYFGVMDQEIKSQLTFFIQFFLEIAKISEINYCCRNLKPLPRRA